MIRAEERRGGRKREEEGRVGGKGWKRLEECVMKYMRIEES